MTIEIIPLSKAKRHLLALVRQVDEGGKRFLLVRDGIPVSVLVPVEEYEAWEETQELLDDEEAMASVRRGLADETARRVYTRRADGRFARTRRRGSTRPGRQDRAQGK